MPEAVKPTAELDNPKPEEAPASVPPKPAAAEPIKSPDPTKKPSNDNAGESTRAPFPVPDGWRVVCRLSPGDVRSRWGSRPRPAAPGKSDGGAVGLEADLVLPEMNQPLRLPLQLLPQWTDPRVGSEFLGRYEVKAALPDRPGARGQGFEVFDNQAHQKCALQVCNLTRESDVRLFVERLQLESLDSEKVLFMRLHDVALALPGRLAIIEDIAHSNLWDEFQRLEPGTNVTAKVAAVANAVLGGLCRLHAHGWAHCGVSPQTICLSQDGAWKLTSLESAKRVREIAAATPTGTTVPPEALLGLPITEKVDVWQLAVTLCEAIMRKRVGGGAQADSIGTPRKMVALVDFLGPLPEGLVAQHPNREELFTPEGHVLRPVTPSGGEQGLEAIEPSSPPVAPADGGHIPRPRLVAEALKDVEGANDILEFLGRLLNPDPEQRPSATEAMAHHFLRFAHTKGAGSSGGAEDNPHVKFDNTGDSGPGGQKPPPAEEAGSKLTRKGTGFVHVGELPPSDDEDEDEDEDTGAAHVKIQDSGEGSSGHVESKLARKGTGFVHVGELPPSDDEDEDDEEDEKPQAKHVHMQEEQKKDAGGEAKGGGMVRKGTGFVHVGELPPSDDEDDEDEEDEKPAAKKVHMSNDEKEKPEPSGGQAGGSKLQRKGTGFVHTGELPVSDDEDEDEDEEDTSKKAGNGKLHFEEEDKPEKKAGGGLARKGTGFVQMDELPDDSDEEDDEEEKHVGFDASAGNTEKKEKDDSKVARKGTGFVNAADIPDSEDEDEDEDTPAKNKVHYDDSAKNKGAEDGNRGATVGKVQRKGTGFVHMSDICDSEDDEDED